MNRLLRTSVRTSSKIWPNKIEASDPGGWDFVEAILPPIQIPTPDMNQKFPTPSGWQPPAKDLLERNYPYHVCRTRFHELDIVEEERESEFYDLNYDNRYENKYDQMLRSRNPSNDFPVTHLKGCSGDVFKLRDEIVSFIEEIIESPIAGQVDEVEGRITITGKFSDFLEEFLFEKGF